MTLRIVYEAGRVDERMVQPGKFRVFEPDSGLELTNVLSVKVSPVESDGLFPPVVTLELQPEFLEINYVRPRQAKPEGQDGPED